MSSTIQRFSWKNRDAAAHDLLQIVYQAPESIRQRALQLLKAFRSPAILSPLQQIVLDETWDYWERRYALYAIKSMPGDIYLPEFARFASYDTFDALGIPSQLSFEDLINLASKHPSNLQWVFQNIERQEPKIYLKALRRATDYFAPGDDMSLILCRRMIEVLELHPQLLDLEMIEALYFRDGSETTLKWLQEHWDELIYLCLIEDRKTVFYLLESWDSLRESVFRNCPAIIEEYDQEKQEITARRLQRQSAPVDYQSSPIWQELNGWYQAAEAGNVQAYSKLASIVYHERDNLCKRAVATNLLGKLKLLYDVRPPLFHALRYAPDDSHYQDLAMSVSVRFEAGEALRDIPSPDVWEMMVDAYFIRPDNVLGSFMRSWIGYLTDQLSGIDKPYSDRSWGDENNRFWFLALAEAEKRDSTKDM